MNSIKGIVYLMRCLQTNRYIGIEIKEIIHDTKRAGNKRFR